jgi:hypothetical protein
MGAAQSTLTARATRDGGIVGDSHGSSHGDAMTTFATAAAAATAAEFCVVTAIGPIAAVLRRPVTCNHCRGGDCRSVRAPRAAITAGASWSTRCTGSACKAAGTATTTTAIACVIYAGGPIASAVSRCTAAAAAPYDGETAGWALSTITTPATAGLSGSEAHGGRNGERGPEQESGSEPAGGA